MACNQFQSNEPEAKPTVIYGITRDVCERVIDNQQRPQCRTVGEVYQLQQPARSSQDGLDARRCQLVLQLTIRLLSSAHQTEQNPSLAGLADITRELVIITVTG
jgi:hypothetical protein